MSQYQEYKRPTLKQHHNFVNNASFDFLTSPILNTIIKFSERKNYFKDRDDFYEKNSFVKNELGQEYGVNFGYSVKSLSQTSGKIGGREVPATVFDLRKTNIYSPVLIDDDSLCRHIQIIGASGSGKTVLIKSLFAQNAMRGGGAFVVLGKGDNEMLQDFYSIACELKREKDFFVFDFVNGATEKAKDLSDKVVTNSISLFDIGESEELQSLLISVSGLTNADDWGQKAVDMIKSGASTLYTLAEAKLFMDFEKLDEILGSENRFETAQKYLIDASSYQLLGYISSYENLFKLMMIIDSFYDELGNFNEILYPVGDLASNIKLEEKQNLEARDKLSTAILRMFEVQASAVDTEKLKALIEEDPKNAFTIYKNEEETSQSAFYGLGIATSKFDTLKNFFKDFNLILGNNLSDISIIDGFRNNKLMVLNIPGQDEIKSKGIARLVTMILKKVNERYSVVNPPKETFMLFLDEINSWAKGSKDESYGIGDLMSVLRSSRISCCVAHQSTLLSMDSGGGIEQDQVEANAEIVVLLKTLSPKIIKELNERFGKVRKLYIKETGENSDHKNANPKVLDTMEIEEDFIKSSIVEKFKPGQGYIIKGGEKSEFIVKMVDSAKFTAKPDKTKRIPINKRVSSNYFYQNFDKGFEAEPEDEIIVEDGFSDEPSIFDEGYTEIQIPKITKQSKQGEAFEKFLRGVYQKEGYQVTDGTGENFFELDAMGVDMVLENNEEVILVQAKNWIKKEMTKDDAILIVSKMADYAEYRLLNEPRQIRFYLAVNAKTQFTQPATEYLKRRETAERYPVTTKKYTFDK